jgi:hypothetical protein
MGNGFAVQELPQGFLLAQKVVDLVAYLETVTQSGVNWVFAFVHQEGVLVSRRFYVNVCAGLEVAECLHFVIC